MSDRDLRVLIVAASPSPGHDSFYTALIRAAAYIIAADNGATLCRAADRPCDLCVGDMDSIEPDTLDWLTAAGTPIRRFPAEKDASDLDLAVDAARELGASTVEITAAFGGRLDHTLASVGTLFRAGDVAARALEPDLAVYVVDAVTRPMLSLAEAPGTVISLFAAERQTLVTVTGVAFPLTHATLPAHTSLGLSNRATDTRQSVEAHSGRVLCIVYHET